MINGIKIDVPGERPGTSIFMQRNLYFGEMTKECLSLVGDNTDK